MKKAKKIFFSILLAVLFAAAMILFFHSYLTKDKEEETENGQLNIKTPKQIYELGEDMDIQGLIWNISEAELLENYETIDSFYKEREFLLSREEYVREYIGQHGDIDLFVDDIRYFRVKCSVTNKTDKAREFSPAFLCPTSIIGTDMIPWSFDCYDVQGVSSKDKNKALKIEGYKRKAGQLNETKLYTIEPEERIEFEVIGELCLYDIYTVDSLQFSKNKDGSFDLYVVGKDSTKRVHLNIAGSFEGNKAYPAARNIQSMKIKSFTNLEQMEWEKEDRAEEGIGGFRINNDEAERIVETEEQGQEFEEIWNHFAVLTTLTDFQITEWKYIPSDFAEQGNLQKMAQRYRDIYNCQEEELKVLILDLNYASSQIGEQDMEVYKIMVNYFYGRSKLYVKDEENALWLFGTADSWLVTENSAHPENIGAVNLDIMELDADISIRMAYLLPPQLYESYSALYFTGGRYELAYDEDEIPITKITLK